jgi:hypothetical protein
VQRHEYWNSIAVAQLYDRLPLGRGRLSFGRLGSSLAQIGDSSVDPREGGSGMTAEGRDRCSTGRCQCTTRMKIIMVHTHVLGPNNGHNRSNYHAIRVDRQ